MTNRKGSFFRSPSFKFLLIGTLSLLLLIPSAMIKGLISERQSRADAAIAEITDSWSTSQTITGPFISVPTERLILQKDESILQENTLHLLPENLTIDAVINPIEKHRGIFKAIVYDSEIQISGNFILDHEELDKIFRENWYINKAYLCIGLNDLRGIGNNSGIKINGEKYAFMPGLYNKDISSKGVHIPIDLKALKATGELNFDISMKLKGSSFFYVNPVGKTTSVNLISNWPDPSFTGAFLPTSKSIDDKGFDAHWEVNYLNRNYPQAWWDGANKIQSALGVHFLIPVDHYQKSERSVKYAFMFIALSFLVFFLTEMILKNRIHPIQYLLVGFALIIFYTLLVALAEQVGFNWAYGISTLAIISLVGFYMKSSTESSKVGLISSLLLAALYGFLYTTLQLQELALLMGSIGLFLILTVIMIVSRKINWYKEENEA